MAIRGSVPEKTASAKVSTGRLREESLNDEIFHSLNEAQIVPKLNRS
jgi:hypothetical protein